MNVNSGINLKGKNFITTQDFTKQQLEYLIDLAIEMKQGRRNEKIPGKTLVLIFFNPSLRTRASFSTAMFQLNGQPIDLTVSEKAYTFEFEDRVMMNRKSIEHVKEGARVLSRYCDAIAVRSSELVTTNDKSVGVNPWDDVKKDVVIKSFVKYATVPIINMESNVYHPCQALGDAVTIKERFSDFQGKKYVLTWAYHPKALPMATANSQLLLPTKLGLDVTLVHPKGWELDERIINDVEKNARMNGSCFKISNNMEEAFECADIVCAKSWGSKHYYGNWLKEKLLRNKLKHWIVDSDKMDLTNDAKFMHCLPVRRNVVATDEVIDSKNSIVIDQAENRLHAQKSILLALLGDNT